MIKHLPLILGLGIVLSLSSAITNPGKAQDPEFSQFFGAPLYLNPAMAGMAWCPRLVFNFRDQWSGQGLNNVYITNAVSYDQHFDAINGGIGVSIMADNAGRGTLKTTSINAMYAYQLRLNKYLTIKAAMQVGYTQRAIDWSKLVFEDQIDPKTGSVDIYGVPNPSSEAIPGSLTAGYLDFASGILVFNQNFFGGLTVKHLSQPNESILGRDQISRVPLRFNLHGGAVIKLNKGINTKTELSPNIMYTQQSVFKQLALGSYISRGAVFAGLWYRMFPYPVVSSDALIMIFGFKKDIFKISYSYDITLSKLTPSSGGSHEFSLALNFCDGDNFLNTKKNAKPIECPKMFTF